MNLEEIKDPSFLKTMKPKQLKALASEIRAFIIENISKTGGHLASNLGVVDLTIAMHYVFDCPHDKIVFDVGHQCYTHKILTGRAKDFKTLRAFNGLSGYMKRKESPYDCYEAGHSSTSISAISGFLKAREKGEDIGEVIAVIGDASLTGGMSFEALNYLGTLHDQHPIIILNDNKMGISKSVGAMAVFLNKVRGTGLMLKIKKVAYKISPNFLISFYRKIARGIKGFIQNDNIFEDLGFQYMGPVDGNDINSVIKILRKAKHTHTPCVVHVITEKGLGYDKAHEDKHGDYHGVPPFDIETGIPLQKPLKDIQSWSEIISDSLIALESEIDINVVIPAMISGSKFERFQALFPGKLVDVGIAEEHAAGMSCAMALSGMKVFLPMYSTFAQRAYDQISHDIARQDANVVIGIDRAGIVGEDGETHQGIYDIAYLSHIPNLIICMPHTADEAYSLLKFAFKQNHPVAIRYPRGSVKKGSLIDFKEEPINFDWTVIHEGKSIVIISYGDDLNMINKLVIDNKFDAMIVNARFIKPIDKAMLDSIASMNVPILVYEEVVINGGLNSLILSYFNEKKYSNHLSVMGIDDKFVTHGSINDVKKSLSLDEKSIINRIKELL